MSRSDTARRVTKWALALTSCNFEFINRKKVRDQAMVYFLLQSGIELETEEYDKIVGLDKERKIWRV